MERGAFVLKVTSIEDDEVIAYLVADVVTLGDVAVVLEQLAVQGGDTGP
jgi:hypothetical protein